MVSMWMWRIFRQDSWWQVVGQQQLAGHVQLTKRSNCPDRRRSPVAKITLKPLRLLGNGRHNRSKILSGRCLGAPKSTQNRHRDLSWGTRGAGGVSRERLGASPERPGSNPSAPQERPEASQGLSWSLRGAPGSISTRPRRPKSSPICFREQKNLEKKTFFACTCRPRARF